MLAWIGPHEILSVDQGGQGGQREGEKLIMEEAGDQERPPVPMTYRLLSYDPT